MDIRNAFTFLVSTKWNRPTGLSHREAFRAAATVFCTSARSRASLTHGSSSESATPRSPGRRAGTGFSASAAGRAERAGAGGVALGRGTGAAAASSGRGGTTRSIPAGGGARPCRAGGERGLATRGHRHGVGQLGARGRSVDLRHRGSHGGPAVEGRPRHARGHRLGRSDRVRSDRLGAHVGTRGSRRGPGCRRRRLCDRGRGNGLRLHDRLWRRRRLRQLDAHGLRRLDGNRLRRLRYDDRRRLGLQDLEMEDPLLDRRDQAREHEQRGDDRRVQQRCAGDGSERAALVLGLAVAGVGDRRRGSRHHGRDRGAAALTPSASARGHLVA